MKLLVNLQPWEKEFFPYMPYCYWRIYNKYNIAISEEKYRGKFLMEGYIESDNVYCYNL